MFTLIYTVRDHAEALADWYRSKGTRAEVHAVEGGFSVWLVRYRTHVELVPGMRCPVL